MIKRGFDIIFSLLVLLGLLPFLLFIAAWVRLDSPGPALFRQVRVGRHGREFRIMKFRTMESAGSEGSQITVESDPRITRSGRFLRNSKLDELPQFLNVLLGDMSVVGPRPEVPRYVALYPDEVRGAVLSVRPGITDLASIEYRDENKLLARSADAQRAYIEEILPRKLQCYLDYVAHPSFRTDLRIVGKTIIALIRG